MKLSRELSNVNKRKHLVFVQAKDFGCFDLGKFNFEIWIGWLTTNYN